MKRETKEELQRQNFKSFMEESKLTSYGWAKRSGVTEGTIRSYLTGRSSSLTYTTLTKLSEVENVSPDDIMNFDKRASKTKISRDYFHKKQLDECIELVDSFIEKNKLNITDQGRKKMYYASYETHEIMKGNHSSKDNYQAIIKTLFDLLGKL